MKGRRIFERFGFNLPPQDSKLLNYQLEEDYEEWIYPNDGNDWVNPENRRM